MSDITPQEHLLLNLLDAQKVKLTKEVDRRRVKGTRDIQTLTDIGAYLGLDTMVPNSTHTCDASDPGRLFSGDPAMLLEHPVDILGDTAEIALLTPTYLKWVGFRRLPCRPKAVCSATMGEHTYYEMHFRTLGVDGTLSSYQQRVIAFNSAKESVPLFLRSAPLSSGPEHLTAYLACSIIEDALRARAYMCSLQDNITVHFPVSTDDIYDFFSLREGPVTPGGRRRALIHWVSKHLRDTGAPEKVRVREHYRGVTEIAVDGLTIRVGPNTRYTAEHTN